MEKSGKGLLNRNQQDKISLQRRMPVDGVGTDKITDITGETVQLYYYASGVLTIDAGQAAGVVVVGKMAQRNIKNALGDVTGTSKDTSLSFTSTALTTEVAFRYSQAELYDTETGNAKADAITDSFTNGQYCVDYRTGTIYGKKASTQVTLTDTAYKVEVPITSGGTIVTSDVNVNEWGGTATTLGQKTSAASVPVVFPSDQSLGSSFLAPTHWSPNDGTVAYTSSTTITCSSFPFTVDDANCTVVAIYYKPTGGTWQSALVNGNGGVSMVASANVITVAGAGTPFAASDTYLVGVKAQDKSYTALTTSDRVEEVDPLDQKFTPDTLLDLTNIATNTTGYGYIDMDGVKYVGIQAETSGATPTDTLTVTLEATVQDDGTAAASCDYQDVTSTLTGSASFVDTDFIGIMDTVIPVKYLRVKYVTSNDAGGDADLTVYTKKLY